MHSNLSKSVPPLPSRRSYDLALPFVTATARRAQSLYCADCLSKSKLGLGVSPKRRNKAIAPYKKSRSQAQSPRCRPHFRGGERRMLLGRRSRIQLSNSVLRSVKDIKAKENRPLFRLWARGSPSFLSSVSLENRGG